MANNMRIKLQNQEPLKLDFSDRLVLKYISPDHSKLDNLDYEHSGHTGFMPAKLSILPPVAGSVQNGRLSLSVYDSETNEAKSIGFNELIGRVIKTVSSVPSDAQKGQYLFLQVNEED